MMRSLFLLGTICVTAIGVCQQIELLDIFAGESTANGGPIASPWGAGDLAEAQGVTYAGEVSFKLYTKGLYKGGIFTFQKPIDLTPVWNKPTAYLRFTVYSTTPLPSSEETTEAAGGPQPGGEGGGAVGEGGGGGGITEGGGMQPPGAAGGGGQQPVPQTTGAFRARSDQFRFVLFFGANRLSVDRQFVEPYKVDDNGWGHYYVPLSHLKGPVTPSTYNLTALALAGNQTEYLYIGKISVITDETPITIKPGDEYVQPMNTWLVFAADADGGASALHYSWDFDASDGIQEDAVGYQAKHFWKKPGFYTVTCTVSDREGIKAPAKATWRVEITE